MLKQLTFRVLFAVLIWMVLMTGAYLLGLV